MTYLIPLGIGVLLGFALLGWSFRLDKDWKAAQRQGGAEGKYKARAIRRKQTALIEWAFLAAVVGVLLAAFTSGAASFLEIPR